MVQKTSGCHSGILPGSRWRCNLQEQAPDPARLTSPTRSCWVSEEASIVSYSRPSSILWRLASALPKRGRPSGSFRRSLSGCSLPKDFAVVPDWAGGCRRSNSNPPACWSLSGTARGGSLANQQIASVELADQRASWASRQANRDRFGSLSFPQPCQLQF